MQKYCDGDFAEGEPVGWSEDVEDAMRLALRMINFDSGDPDRYRDQRYVTMDITDHSRYGH